MQKNEANSEFAKFVKRNYESWVNGGKHPLMSNEIIKYKLNPLIDDS